MVFLPQSGQSAGGGIGCRRERIGGRGGEGFLEGFDAAFFGGECGRQLQIAGIGGLIEAGLEAAEVFFRQIAPLRAERGEVAIEPGF